MATVNLKEVMEAVQKKIYAADSSTSNLQDLIYLLKSAKRGDGTMVQQVASASVLPDLTDSAADTEMIAFVQDEGKLYFKQDSSGTTVWKTYTVTPSTLIVQGSSYGYTTGGAASPVLNNTQSLTQILQFSFTSDGNATDVGDINPAVPLGRVASSSQTSSTHGYHSGGLYTPPQISSTNNIQKWSFTSPYNGSDVADLSIDTFRPYGSSSPTDGYSTGGRGGTPMVYLTVHDKFPTSSDTNATDNGDLTAGRYQTGGGNSSGSASYFAGGNTPTGIVNVIEKIPFAAGGTATDVGDLTTPNINSTGANTSDYGYSLGGSNNGYAEANLNVIQRFSYSSDGNATDYADLANGVYTGAGCSSTSYGYTTGGQSSPGAPQTGAAINVIQKFPFSTATNGTDVGDLTSILANHSGNQN